jgi:dipeptidyl aminopeptidase/acylaminoacyl peptidase
MSSLPATYLFYREQRRLHFLFDAYPQIEPRALSPMQSVSFKARDGLDIHGYLTLPSGGPQRNLPAIVYPHGGPSARDVWGYDPTVQFLASRGFAVFQPNFRGSAGYGAKHREAGHRQWGLSMQDDLTDAARWLIEQGIADPQRVGIYGGSYGGYAARMGLVKAPELFRAGATFAGVTDLPMLVDDDSGYDLEEVNKPILGGGWGDRGRLARLSLTRNVEHIRAPWLIAHGTEDWRVHVRQAEALADALRDAGKPVELYLYDREVHGFIDERNQIDFHEKLSAFFERHLGPAGPSGERDAAGPAAP